MQLPPLTAGQSFLPVSIFFRGRASMAAAGPIAVSDLECIQSQGWNALYCMTCPLIFSGCVHAA
jgi:hypothetical protein